MDSCSPNPHPHIDALEAATLEYYRLFFFYHPQYQHECPSCEEDQYASFISELCEISGESSAHHITNVSTAFDPNDGYFPSATLEMHERDQSFPQHEATIPPGKMSTYSELMPHVVAYQTTVSLKRDVMVATQPQPCVSPALCQGHADLPEWDDELDCPGSPASDLEAESSDGEENGQQSHPTPLPSPLLSPYSDCCEPPRTSRAVRSVRSKNRYSPMKVEVPSQKRKSTKKRASFPPDDEEPKKSKKRREAVSLACYFCRKRKIACRQPPPGSLDRTCNQCKIRGMECQYPTESRRGARRGSASSHKQDI